MQGRVQPLTLSASDKRALLPAGRAGEDSGACGHGANAGGPLQRPGRASVFGVSVAAARSKASTLVGLARVCLPARHGRPCGQCALGDLQV